MGNHMCCANPSRSTAVAKVIRWDDGSFEEFKETINVGEVMVDNPQKFVCDFSNLQAGRRIVALRAEEDLALGGVYVLLPMQKYLRRVVSSLDMASFNSLAFKCNSGQRKSSCNSVIFPAVGTGNSYEFASINSSAAERSDELKAKEADLFAVPKTESEEDEIQSLMGFRLGEQSIRRFRYWKPSLATIKESPLVCKP